MHEGKELKKKLSVGEVCLGSWISFSDPTVSEVLAGSGFDFLIIDCEHSPQCIQSVQTHVMACKGTDTTPVARVAWNDAVLIKQVLDVGVGGVLVPLIRSAEEARNAVAACWYPPAGIRGYGPRRPSNYDRISSGYTTAANEDIVIWVQIEHTDAVDAIDEIVRVPGLSGVFIGPNDLSGSLGLLGQPAHPEVMAAINRVIAAGKEVDLPVGIFAPPNPDLALEWVRKGIRFMTVGSDQGYLVSASELIVKGIKAHLT